MWLRLALLGTFLLLVAAYVGWPYYTLYRINAALDAGDRATLDLLVDWQVVREGLKTEVEERHAPAAAAGGERAGGLAALLAPRVNEMLVDAYASPQGLARLIKEGDVAAANAVPQASPGAGAARAADNAADETAFTPAVSHAVEFAKRKLIEARALVGRTYRSLREQYDYVFFTDPVTFRVEYARTSPAQTAPLVLVLRLQDGRWRLTRVTLPRQGDGG